MMPGNEAHAGCEDSYGAGTALYVDAGIGGIERGAVSAGYDPGAGHNGLAQVESVAFAIPRRVYTHAHLDDTAESVIGLSQNTSANPRTGVRIRTPGLGFPQAGFAPGSVAEVRDDAGAPALNAEGTAQPFVGGRGPTGLPGVK